MFVRKGRREYSSLVGETDKETKHGQPPRRKTWWRCSSKTISYVHSKLLWDLNIWVPYFKDSKWNDWGIIWWTTDFGELNPIGLLYMAWLVSGNTYRTHPFVHDLLVHTTRPGFSKLANNENKPIMRKQVSNYLEQRTERNPFICLWFPCKSSKSCNFHVFRPNV